MNEKTETLLDVQGMSCPSCVRHIDHALSDVEGVARVEVRLREGKVLVQHDGRAAPIEALIEALRAAGYEASAPLAA
jgi:copper chaperone